MKRLMSVCLVLALLLCVVPVGSKAAQGGKLAAITFDDGPSSSYTPILLDGLKERGVKVSFFTLGSSGQYNVDILRRAYDEGHELANHSWDHPNLCELSDSQVLNQINWTNEVLDQVCGKGTKYLVRPPYGNTNDHIESLIQAPLIYWSVDPRDWATSDAYEVRDNILWAAHDGAIILVHDIHESSVYGALMAIDALLEDGYELVTVSDLYRRRGVTMNDSQWQYSCKPNGVDYGPLKKPQITYTVEGSQMTVTLNSENQIPIYYTTDGTLPNGNSPVYSGPFQVPYPTDIRAVAAVNLNGVRSEVESLIYGETACPKPEISKNNGLVEMNCSAPGAVIHYTVDGTDATMNSTAYTGPVELPGNVYLHAVAGEGFYAVSSQTVLYHSQNGILYADIQPDRWYFTPIDRLAATGIMNGVGDHYFEPNEALTRAMAAKVIYEYSQNKLEAGWNKTHQFTDVKDGTWYAEAIEWCFRNQLINGYPDGTFQPNARISRQELSAMVDRLESFRKHPFEKGESVHGKFSDSDMIQGWAVPSMEALVHAGLLQGDDGRLKPRDNATRAEFATVFSRLMDYEASFATPQPEETKPAETEPAESQPAETAASSSVD